MDAGSVQVVYSANVEQFIANAKKADTALENSGKVAEATSKRQRDAAQFAAKFEADAVADSTRKIIAARQQVAQATGDYSRIQGMVRAGMLDEAQGAQAVGAALQRLTTARQQLVAVTQTTIAAEKADAAATKAAGEAAGAASVLHLSNASAMKAEAEASAMVSAGSGHLTNSARTVSGAFMEMEGRMPIRSLERMIGQSEALAPLMEAAFPVVGAVAAGEVIGDLAGTIARTYDEWFNYRDAVDAAMKKDQEMAAQFEQDAHQAENLRRSLMELAGGRRALAAAGYNPASGAPPTAKQMQVEERGEREAGARYTLDQDENNVATLQGQLTVAADKAHKLQMIVDGITYGDRNKASIDLGPAEMAVTNAQQELTNATNQQTVDTAQVQKDRMRTAAELQAQSLQEAQRASAAQRKAQEDALRGMEAGREQQIQEGRRGAQADLDYWLARVDSTRLGAAQHLQVSKKITEDEASLARAAEQYRAEQARGDENGAKNEAALAVANVQLDLASHRITKLEADDRTAAAQTAEYTAKLAALRQELGELNRDLTTTPEEKRVRVLGVQNQIKDLQGQHAAQLVQNQAHEAGDVEEAAHAVREQVDATAALTEAQQKNADAARQMILAHQASRGQISKESEAQQLAALHAAEYGAQLDKLAQDRADIQGDGKLSEQQKTLALTKLDVQVTNVQGDAARAAMVDQWNAQEQTAVGGFISALQQISSAGQDYASEMKSLTDSTIKGLNDTLLKGLTTPHMTGRDWHRDLGNYGAGLFRDVAGIGLRSGESAATGPLAALLSNHVTTPAGLGANDLCRTESRFTVRKAATVAGLPLPVAA